MHILEILTYQHDSIQYLLLVLDIQICYFSSLNMTLIIWLFGIKVMYHHHSRYNLKPIFLHCLTIIHPGLCKIQSQIHYKSPNFNTFVELPLTTAFSCSGNTARFTHWNEIARKFVMEDYDNADKHLIVAVSSWWVKTYRGKFINSQLWPVLLPPFFLPKVLPDIGLQLPSTPVKAELIVRNILPCILDSLQNICGTSRKP